MVSWKPRAFIYHNFLSNEEAEHMKQLAAPTVSVTAVVFGPRSRCLCMEALHNLLNAAALQSSGE